MLKQILVPDIGSFSGVSIIEIMVKPGDMVAFEASLITLETDKATIEIPSPYAGKIEEIKVALNDKVSQGDLILTMDVAEATEAPAADTKETPKQDTNKADQKTAAEPESLRQPTKQNVVEEPKATPKDTQQPTTLAGSNVDRIAAQSSSAYAGPAVRRFARELGVDLSKVLGTGRKGRIVVADIKSYVKQALTTGSQTGGQSGGLGFNLPAWPAIDHAKFGEVTVEALSRIKKISGSYLHRNWVTVPHVTQFDEADITELEKFRKESQTLAEHQGIKLTPLVFIMKAVVTTLKEFPAFNASLDATASQLTLKKYYHLGVAVDTPNGLVVPVVRDVDQKGLFQLAKELGELSHKARKGQLTAQEMQGSSFSISSLGGIGGTGFTPIVNVPDVAILGVSKAQMKPIYLDHEFKPRLMLPLSLSYDHRVVDGAEAARFTSFLVKQLSDIRRLLL